MHEDNNVEKLSKKIEDVAFAIILFILIMLIMLAIILFILIMLS